MHAQSGELFFLRQLRWSAPEASVHGIRAVGLEGEEPPRQTIEEMADRYVAAIRAVQPQGPYWLGGYCMGGLVAFEMARRLVTAGEQIASLLLLDTALRTDLSSVDAVPATAGQDVDALMREVAEDDVALPPRPGGTDGPGGDRDDGPYWDQILRDLKGRARLAPDLDAELYRHRLAVSAWNTIAASTYRARPADVRVEVLASTDYGDVAELAAAWTAVAGRGAAVRSIEKTHFDFFYSDVLRAELTRRAQALRGAVTSKA